MAKMPTAEQISRIQQLLKIMSVPMPHRVGPVGSGHARNYATAAKLWEELSGEPSKWPDDAEKVA